MLWNRNVSEKQKKAMIDALFEGEDFEDDSSNDQSDKEDE